MGKDISKLMKSVSIADKKPVAARRKGARGTKRDRAIPLDAELTKTLEEVAAAAKISEPELRALLQTYTEERWNELALMERDREKWQGEVHDAYNRGLNDGLVKREAGFNVMPPMVSVGGHQCAAARALLGWSQTQLAEASGVGLSCVSGFESGRQCPRDAQRDRMRTTLELAGIEFLGCSSVSGAGDGVRQRTDRDEINHGISAELESNPEAAEAFGALVDATLDKVGIADDG